jgi:hypothetical protein
MTIEQQCQPDFASRAVHLIDAENLVGSPCFTCADAARIADAYAEVATISVGDHLIIATSHYAAASTWFGWPAAARRLLRSGPHAADHALIDVLATEGVEGRYRRVVIGSGDGIFALEAARLQADGCAVTVVSRRAGLSRHLRLAVRDIRFLDSAPASAPAIILGRRAA